MRLVECVPNFSEGRRPEVVSGLRDAIASAPGVLLLHTSADVSHNRSVITFAAPPAQAVGAAFAGIRAALDLIDIREHTGVHPRIGACDVVPFVPLGETTMDDCVALARELGERVARELGIPVYLYERAAVRAERSDLAVVRRGGLEALRQAIATDPARSPDMGPDRVHPTFGAIAIGARPHLVAFNVYLGDATHVPAARRIAREVRFSSGGLAGVKALGLEVDGQAQVSMNLVDIERTPVHVAVEAVREAARRRGIDVTWSELIGLIPESAVTAAAGHALAVRDLTADRVLEQRLAQALWGGSVLLDGLSTASPAPAGASAAAYAGAMAGALGVMIAGIAARSAASGEEDALTSLARRARGIRDALALLVERDAAAVRALIAVSRRTIDAGASDAASRTDGGGDRQAAVWEAIRVPLEIARGAAEAAEIAESLVHRGKPATRTDALAAVLLAEAAARTAWATVRANAGMLQEKGRGDSLIAEAEGEVRRAAAARESALAAVR